MAHSQVPVLIRMPGMYKPSEWLPCKESFHGRRSWSLSSEKELEMESIGGEIAFPFVLEAEVVDKVDVVDAAVKVAVKTSAGYKIGHEAR